MGFNVSLVLDVSLFSLERLAMNAFYIRNILVAFIILFGLISTYTFMIKSGGAIPEVFIGLSILALLVYALRHCIDITKGEN